MISSTGATSLASAGQASSLSKRCFPGAKWMRSWLAGIYLLSYVALLPLILFHFDDATKHSATGFLLINAFLAAFFISLDRSGSDRPLFYLLHAFYSLAYVFKALILPVLGLRTDYLLLTLRTTIETNDYLRALSIVTLGHVLLVGFFLSVSCFRRRPSRRPRTKQYLTDRALLTLLFLSLIAIILSSVIMYHGRVAVMGSPGISLPYKLSGVLFYSRTIVIPLVILYAIEKAVTRERRGLFFSAIFIYLVLAASDMLIRASKAPALTFLLFLVFLYVLLRACSVPVHKVIRKKLLFSLGLAALLAFPAIDIYRAIRLSQPHSTRPRLAIDQYFDRYRQQHVSPFLVPFERLFHRLVGFPQMAGLIADDAFDHDYSSLSSYHSIAHYYTSSHLGIESASHLSSPSLLGASLILGGQAFWHLIIIAYLILITTLWRLAARFRHLELPIKCMMGFEAANTVIAGTLDMSVYRLTLIIVSSLVIELAISVIANQPRCRPAYRRAPGTSL